MRHSTTKGIVLKKVNFGEYDQFIILLCPELGKIEAVAKGARKISSSFTGHLELLNLCKFQLYKTAHNYTITQCQNEKTFSNIKKDLDKSMIAQVILEIIQRTSHSAELHEELFYLVISTLEILDKKNTNGKLILQAFKLKLVQLMGALPEIKSCYICHKKWGAEDNICYDTDGRIICSEHGKNIDKISFNLIKILHFFLSSNMEEISRLNINLADLRELAALNQHLLEPYTGDLKSENLIT